MLVANNVFVVTGRGNGIGREVVLKLLSKGARVAAFDLRPEGLAETAAQASAGSRLSTQTVDVSEVQQVEASAADVLAQHGRVDGLLNVAGIIQPFVPFAQLHRSDMKGY